MIFQYINVCPVPREMLKTLAYGLGFQHLPRDVNAWKTMFDPYTDNVKKYRLLRYVLCLTLLNKVDNVISIVCVIYFVLLR